MRNKAALVLLAALLPVLCAAQDDELSRTGPTHYSPPSRSFTCDMPAGWSAFEEQDGLGGSVHLLGPDDPQGVFRAGMDIRLSEKGDASFTPYKQALEEMRRSDGASGRSTTAVRLLRLSGALVRVFEITETRRLPDDRWPSTPVELHRFVAVFPSGESYFTLTLSSTRDTYMDYRDLFLAFLKNFRPLGYK